MNNNAENTAVLYSSQEPDEIQKKRFEKFIRDNHGDDFRLVWQKNESLKGGFRLKVASKVYDWTVGGRLRQLKDTIASVRSLSENVVPLLKDTLSDWIPEALAEEIGTVITVGDGIATVSGLENVAYGEILMFASGVKGMAQNLNENDVGCILFDDDNDVCEGSTVRRTGRTAGIPVGDNFLGRVINALGAPIDGRGNIKSDKFFPVERPAPGIIDRAPVNKPLETGILSIDSMFPIGKGQRELIIGDRQTGKTAIALDTIINQKDRNIICIYVAIGQKASSVAQLYQNLKKHGAADYTVIINASASDAAPLQYIAPYAGCAMGEYFMNNGKDVLIIYDDLSKHAIAYRTLSLLLGRSPGREAYPGDVFYLHSRLLERSAHLCDELGGGSMTALPIVETQAGDVSAYIPTNIISITDGQIFLESDLFFSGQRPAVNVGLSVSRVGGAAQTKAMKKSSGTIRLDLAQYREMEVFTQFAGDLDDVTKNQLAYGQGLMRMLRQNQYSPYKQYEQVIILITALNHIMQNVPPDGIGKFISGLLNYYEENHRDICDKIESEREIDEDDIKEIVSYSRKFAEIFAHSDGR